MELGGRLATSSVLDEVNGLCNLCKQVSGGRRSSSEATVSQGSSVTRGKNRVWFRNVLFYQC